MKLPSRPFILLLTVSILVSPVLGADDTSSVLSTLPVPTETKIIKTTSPHGDRLLKFAVQDEISRLRGWVLKELKNQGWEISGKKSESESDDVLGAQKNGFELSVSLTQSGQTILVTYALFEPTSPKRN